MTGIIGIALSGVRAMQGALETVADNVANAATPGFARRVPRLATAPGGGSLSPLERDLLSGNGVLLTGIARATDLLRVDSLRRTEGEVAALAAATRWFATIEGTLTGPASLAGPLADFFGAAADLAADPSAVAVRATFLARAGALADRFNGSAAALDRIRADIDSEARVEVQRINDLAAAIRDTNALLRRATPGGSAAAVLADERDRLLSELASIAGIDVRFDARGVATVRLPDAGGPVLVDGLSANPARLEPVAAGGYRLRVGELGDDVPATVLGGTLAGLSAARQLLTATRERLDALADRLAADVNRLHRAGVDLTGAAGQDLFGTRAVRVRAALANGGEARISARLADGAAPPPLRLTYNGATAQWTLARADLSASVSGTLPLALDGVTVEGSGTPRDGDVFTLAVLQGAAGIHLRPLEPAEVAAADALIADAAADNRGSGQLTLLDAPRLDPPAVPPFRLLVLAGSLLELRDGADTLLAAGPLGATLAGDGFAVRLSGRPAEGDQFRILPNSSGGGGGTAVRIAALRALGGPQGTLEEANDRLVTGISVPLAAAQTRLESARGARDALAAALHETAGVDLNREAADMLRFQQALQANARVIQAARETFEAILAAGR